MHSNKITEQQNCNTMDIDQKSIKDILEIINFEDSIVHLAVDQSIDQIEKFINQVVYCLSKGGRLFYIGAGTSGRIGVLDASECPPTFSTNPDMVQGIIAGGKGALTSSIEGAEDQIEKGKQEIIRKDVSLNDIVLGITAGGTAKFVLGALEQAKVQSAYTGLLICNESPKPKYVDQIIKILVGPEVVTGSTRMKAGTATKMVLNMITTTTMIKLNKTYGNVMVDLNACNEKLWDRAIRIIMHFTKLDYIKSSELLKHADGEVKTALLMEKMDYTYKDAKSILKSNPGALREIKN